VFFSHAFFRSDAAHTVHPLAGQGVNLGFGDASSLATAIIEGVRTGQDIGSLIVLKNYQDQRMVTNLTMLAGVEGIKRIFESNFMPFTVARNLGLTITNAFTPLKQQLQKYAMGATVDVSAIGSPKQNQVNFHESDPLLCPTHFLVARSKTHPS
jgi:2-polyprenyl-6-methoxyphenol hydroxylase-like FAD-dependent oxidoreductase